MIQILSPTDGAEVEGVQIVRGRVSDPDSDVFVIVHPLRTSSYWVQQNAVIAADGEWTIRVFLGTETTGVGEFFELLAVVDPTQRLREGLVLDQWPPAEAVSDLVVVSR